VHVPEHDPQDSDGAHEIEAWLTGGGCVEEFQVRLL
jgi:hypothetical protein